MENTDFVIDFDIDAQLLSHVTNSTVLIGQLPLVKWFPIGQSQLRTFDV